MWIKFRGVLGQMWIPMSGFEPTVAEICGMGHLSQIWIITKHGVRPGLCMDLTFPSNPDSRSIQLMNFLFSLYKQ